MRGTTILLDDRPVADVSRARGSAPGSGRPSSPKRARRDPSIWRPPATTPYPGITRKRGRGGRREAGTRLNGTSRLFIDVSRFSDSSDNPAKPIKPSQSPQLSQRDLIENVTLPTARSHLEQDVSRDGHGMLLLPEFSPSDLARGSRGRDFLKRHGIVCVRVDTSDSPGTMAQLLERVNDDVKARGVTTTGIDDLQLQERMRHEDSTLPYQLRHGQIGSGHVRQPPNSLPLLEAGITLDRIGQSSSAWKLRAESAPVFDALFGTSPSDPETQTDEQLLADAMPMGVAVPRQRTRASAFRPQVPTAQMETTSAGRLYNALRPIRPSGVLEIVPGMHLLVPGGTMTGEAVRTFFSHVTGLRARVDRSMRRSVVLRPHCVYLWSQSTWAALGTALGATKPVLVQYQRFRPLHDTCLSERHKRQWSFMVRARGIGGSLSADELVRRAGVPTYSAHSDGPPRQSPWRRVDEVTVHGATKSTFPPYCATVHHGFPKAPDYLTEERVSRRPLSLVGGSVLVTPSPPPTHTVADILESLLPSTLRNSWRTYHAVEKARLQALRKAEREARERQTMEIDDHLCIGGASATMADYRNTLNEQNPSVVYTIDDVEKMMKATLLGPGSTVPASESRSSPPRVYSEVLVASQSPVPSFPPPSPPQSPPPPPPPPPPLDTLSVLDFSPTTPPMSPTLLLSPCQRSPSPVWAPMSRPLSPVLGSEDQEDQNDRNVDDDVDFVRITLSRCPDPRNRIVLSCVLCPSDAAAQLAGASRLLVRLDRLPPAILRRYRRRAGPAVACATCVLINRLWHCTRHGGDRQVYVQ